jgi:IS1 family transposase
MRGMNKLAPERRTQILAMMVEGVSIRAIARLTGASKNTIVKLLREAGEACLDCQDAALRDLPCKRVQCDEIWSFVHSKQKNVPEDRKGEFGIGDVWTWTALCADTKIVPCWHVGDRDTESAKEFMDDLAGRLRSRVQLTTDGHSAYLSAVDGAFGLDVDYAMLVKLYGPAAEGKPGTAERKYSPGECQGSRKTAIVGRPVKEDVSTSYVECQNLTMRMSLRRFTRLTNAFSKKVENHVHALSIYFMHYNFVRIDQSLRVPPAMAAGVTDRLWGMDDVVAMIDAAAPQPAKRGPYRKAAK